MSLLGHVQKDCAYALGINQTTVSRWLRGSDPTSARAAVEDYCGRAEAYATERGIEIRGLSEYRPAATMEGPGRGAAVDETIGVHEAVSGLKTQNATGERVHDGLRVVPAYEIGDAGAQTENTSAGEGARRFRDNIVEPRMVGGQPLSDTEIAYHRDLARAVYGVPLESDAQ